ncbi:ATP-dependent DNA helicase PIF1-like protein [Tanacetum coccineum]
MKSKFGYQKESKSQQMQRQIKSESKSHSKKKTVKQTPAMTPKVKLTPIKDISPMVTNMRIRGRVISKWHAHKLNQAHDPYSLELVLQDEEGDRIQNTNVTRVDQIDDNLIGFRNEPFTRILDTNVEYEENNSVDVIGTVVGIGDVVAVNSIGACKIRRTIFIEDEETQMYINKSIPEPLSFRHRYEGQEEYDANEHRIQLVSHETKIVTPQEFMHGAVKQLVASIRETELMLSLLHGDEKTYSSSDTVGVADVDTNFNETMYTEEFLNNLNMVGIPHHSIKLKIAKIISGGSVGTICAIPRMVISPSDTKLLYKLNQRQFPVQICFGMKINKSQGQTLSKVGLFLQRQVFSHGQLYVAVSMVKTKKGLKVLCCDKDGNYTNSTTNVVYKEALYRI